MIDGEARVCEVPLRADARRNRERIVEAARRVFADDGLDVSMTKIAARAGVGIATVLRRFPDREALIAAVFVDRMAAYVAVVEESLAADDPWEGFAQCLESVCAMQAQDRGFMAVMTRTFESSPQFEAERQRAQSGFAVLIERAQRAGVLRPEVTVQDLALVFMANAGVVGVTAAQAPEAWRRHLGYILCAWSADGEVELPEAPSPDCIARAMAQGCPG